MASKQKKTNKKGKKQGKGRKHETAKVWKKYEIKGDSVSRKNKFCPRCGEGVWLSKQENRLYCGKCGYTSFGPGKGTSSEPKNESQPEGPEKPGETPEGQPPRDKEGGKAEESGSKPVEQSG